MSLSAPATGPQRPVPIAHLPPIGAGRPDGAPERRPINVEPGVRRTRIRPPAPSKGTSDE